MTLSAFQAEPRAYAILDPLPWARLATPLAKAEDAIARLDERLRKSTVADGLIARTHFYEACASLWLDGELVHVEDLVLHDAVMDARAPTAELVRAHLVLRARRRVAKAQPGWALTASGLDALRGRAPTSHPPADTQDVIASDQTWAAESGEEWSKALAAIDAVVARSEAVLAGTPVERRPREDRPSLVYDLDWDEDARLASWRRVADDAKVFPATLAAAIALDAWAAIEPLQSQSWLGWLLACDLLRGQGKTKAHLPALAVGLKAIPQQKRWKRDPATRVEVALEALAAGAEAGLKEHDRLVTAHTRLTARTAGRRSNSRLPALVDLALEVPVASADMIAGRLKVTPRAALMLAGQLGLRETTGRSRYRAWSAL